MDPVGLWNIFKPFGRVRDVYLSSKSRARRSLFAFIRFETMEEATKVARLTNKMYVYGWPIVSKVASYGWNKRINAEGLRHQNEAVSKEKGMKGGPVKQSINGNKTFVEVLKGNSGMKGS